MSEALVADHESDRTGEARTNRVITRDEYALLILPAALLGVVLVLVLMLGASPPF